MAWAEYGSCPITVGDQPAAPVGLGADAKPRVTLLDADPDAIRVDRRSKWGNPFTIGRDGSRREVIRKHREWLAANPDLLAQLPELRGKNLACHCYPEPCHAETLIEWANNPDLIPSPAMARSAPVPVPQARSRVLRPAADGPIRIMVTGSRDWQDTGRLADALSWAARTAHTQYPGRRLELVHGAADGADTMAATYWQHHNMGTVQAHPVTDIMWRKEGRGAGHARNARMVTTTPHVVLAFDRNGSPGTQSAIQQARQAGLPVYVFHDTDGVTSHTHYPPRPSDTPTTQLVDATEPDFATTINDETILGYHNPTIPFRGINTTLGRHLNATETINGVDHPPPPR